MRNREEKKCKKGQESTIGKIIYGFLLFMPLFAIGVTCGYAMFNKNAYQSYANNVIDNIFNDSYKTITLNKDIVNTTSFNNLSTNIITNNIDYTGTTIQYDSLNYYFYNQNTSRILWANNSQYIVYSISNWNNVRDSKFYYFTNNITNTLSYDITIQLTNSNYEYTKLSITEDLNTLNTNKLSNVFYDSVDKVTKNPLFNWAENSIIYTTTSNTCNALSITTPFIPLLLAYWLIISVIYFLYDIALMLVWIIHRKIHKMQESI